MIRPEDDGNGIARLAQGDPNEVRRIRANLAVFARRARDRDTTELVNDVLAGRRDIRDVVNSESFRRVAESNVANLEEGLRRMPDEQRTRLLDAARRQELPITDRDEIDTLRGPAPPRDEL